MSKGIGIGLFVIALFCSGIAFTQETVSPDPITSPDSLWFAESISVFNTSTAGGGLTTLLQGSDGYWQLKLILPEIISLPNGLTYRWNGRGWLQDGSTNEYLFDWRL